MTNTTQTTTVTTAVEFGKMLKADKFRFIAEQVESVEVREFLEIEASRIEAKNSKRVTKKTKAQVENDEIRGLIKAQFEEFQEGTILVADEIMAYIGQDVSAQKATALMKGLVDCGDFEKVEAVEVVSRIEKDGEYTTRKTKKVGYKLA